MTDASENQPAMFLGIFFSLRSAVVLDFELATEHVPNKDGIKFLFAISSLFCLKSSGDFNEYP